MITRALFNMIEHTRDIVEVLLPDEPVYDQPEETTGHADEPLHHLIEFEAEMYEQRFCDHSDQLILTMFAIWIWIINIAGNYIDVYNTPAPFLLFIMIPILWFFISLKFRINEETYYHLPD